MNTVKCCPRCGNVIEEHTALLTTVRHCTFCMYQLVDVACVWRGDTGDVEVITDTRIRSEK